MALQQQHPPPSPITYPPTPSHRHARIRRQNALCIDSVSCSWIVMGTTRRGSVDGGMACSVWRIEWQRWIEAAFSQRCFLWCSRHYVSWMVNEYRLALRASGVWREGGWWTESITYLYVYNITIRSQIYVLVLVCEKKVLTAKMRRWLRRITNTRTHTTIYIKPYTHNCTVCVYKRLPVIFMSERKHTYTQSILIAVYICGHK